MAPPSFNDIGKKFKDLYSKQFPSGFLKCIAKFPIVNGVSLSLDGTQKFSDGQFTSNIEAKVPLKISNLDVTWIEKWTSKNELSTNFEVNLIKDVSNGIEVLYEPLTGRTSMKAKNSYKSEQLTASGDVKFKTSKPEVSLSFMTNLLQNVPLQGGGSITFDCEKTATTNVGYGIQLDKGDICMSASVTNNTEFLSQIYMKLSDVKEIGLEAGWNQDSKKPRFSGVSQLKISSDSFIKARISSSGTLSMGYSFPTLPGVRLTLGMSLDIKNITCGNNEFGLQVEL